ncbi:MAG: ECF-type sigma factor [Candidatus Eisenbacteria bacterium]|nr:ECF-type sigma factor [Candidatus Eisenbacteria bacterium]
MDRPAEKNLASLIPLIYDELRALARARLLNERQDHTLQPTALVHEVFLKLCRQESVEYASRCHLLAVAAEAMRRILIDHARRHLADKRGGDWARITLFDDVALARDGIVDLLALEMALEQLESRDATAAEVVVCRFYGGMTEAEIGERLGITERWVRHHWRHARAWLRMQLDESHPSPGPDALAGR